MEKVKDFIYKVISTYFYCGLFPYAPGTIGTLGGIITYIILWKLNILNFFILLFLFFIFSIGNILVGDWAEEYFKSKDPKNMVIDEVAGIFFTLLFFKPSIVTIILSFILFRIFDIFKPFPIKRLEKINGGIGILIDDILASIYAILSLFIIMLVATTLKVNLNISLIFYFN